MTKTNCEDKILEISGSIEKNNDTEFAVDELWHPLQLEWLK